MRAQRLRRRRADGGDAIRGDAAPRELVRPVLAGHHEPVVRRRVDLVAGAHTQEGLRADLPAGTLLLAAAEGARRDVLDADFLPLYRTIELTPDVPDADVALLMSASAVRALVATGARMPVVAIGPQTATQALELGLEVAAVAERHDAGGLIDALRSL